ncbi:MAG: prepilin peptidase [Oscillospiraceae bacterium]|nr:prepilin peptidase [Oscillospiraceae bacterium]MDY6208691.1 prepilin peptidase [Oscillospiraceae bacterium]
MSSLSIDTLETIMTVTIYVFVFLFGITIGSFLNVCIYRLPKGESLITNNSHCMTCGTQIKRYDLIPVLSWIILRGRCRACGAKITPRYMIIELMTGLIFLGVFMRYDFMTYGLYPVMLCLFMAGLIVLCFQDVDTQEMCVSVLVYTFLIAAVSHVLSFINGSDGKLLTFPEITLKDGIIGMFCISLPLLLIGFVITPLFYNAFADENRKELRGIKANLKRASQSDRNYNVLVSKKEALEAKIKEQSPVYGFGMGDVVLMAAGGLMLGVKATVTAALIAVFTGAVYGIILKSVRKEESEQSNAFAFGPFLIIGLTVGAFVGGKLIDMYLQSFVIR